MAKRRTSRPKEIGGPWVDIVRELPSAKNATSDPFRRQTVIDVRLRRGVETIDVTNALLTLDSSLVSMLVRGDLEAMLELDGERKPTGVRILLPERAIEVSENIVQGIIHVVHEAELGKATAYRTMRMFLNPDE